MGRRMSAFISHFGGLVHCPTLALSFSSATEVGRHGPEARATLRVFVKEVIPPVGGVVIMTNQRGQAFWIPCFPRNQRH